MTYFGFLAIFLLIPIALLALLHALDRRSGRQVAEPMRGLPAHSLLPVLVLIAVTWTTPWDNYLVATEVWWYDESLVTGILLGWVPLEEYCFFVVQPIMTGLFTVWLMRRGWVSDAPPPAAGRALRTWSTGICLALAIGMWLPLLLGWRQFNYLALQLIWALPPIALQLGFGADILWQQRKLVAAALGGTTLYLAAADTIAIMSGTWTIAPEQSLVWLKIGPLPFEEALFFFLTNTLCVFTMVLGMARVSQARLPARFRTNPA